VRERGKESLGTGGLRPKLRRGRRMSMGVRVISRMSEDIRVMFEVREA